MLLAATSHILHQSSNSFHSPAHVAAVHAAALALSNVLPVQWAGVRERLCVAVYVSIGLWLMPTQAKNMTALIASSDDPLRWLSMMPLLVCVLSSGGFTRSVRYFWCRVLTYLKLLIAAILVLPPLCFAVVAPDRTPHAYWAMCGVLGVAGHGMLWLLQRMERHERLAFETTVL